MIHANRIVTVGDQESIIDRPIVLYRGDREVEIEFTLVGNEFTFSEEGNVIKSVNASHGQLVLNTPSGEHMFSELAECHEGKVVFVVTKEMIDEFIEMGFYSFQIRLYDSVDMISRVTIPPVMNGFDIRNPIAAEDETNVVDQGIVDYARVFKDQSNEELSTFDWQGNYNKTEWAHHDVITENKMNKIEDAIYSINANIKESDIAMLNTLDQVKKDADKYVKEHMAEVEADVDEFERNLNTDVQTFKVDTNAAMTAHMNEVSELLERKIYCCSSVADLIITDFKKGDTVKTLSYYSEANIGGGIYEITDKKDNLCLSLDNGLFAKLIVENELNIFCMGVTREDTNNNNAEIINECASICIGKKLTLFMPYETIEINNNISLFGLKDINIRGVINCAVEGLKVEIGYNSNVPAHSFYYINNISEGTLSLTGLKRGYLQFQKAKVFEIVCDSEVSGKSSNAYNTILLGDCEAINITRHNDGWINENLFIGGRAGVLNMNTGHNNVFLKLCIEGDVEGNGYYLSGNCADNKFIDARGEGYLEIQFGEDTRRNIIEVKFASDFGKWGLATQLFVQKNITDLGQGNRVSFPEYNYEAHTIATVNSSNYNTELATEANGMVTPKHWSNLLESKVCKCPTEDFKLEFSSSVSGVFRLIVILYDENMTPTRYDVINAFGEGAWKPESGSLPIHYSTYDTHQRTAFYFSLRNAETKPSYIKIIVMPISSTPFEAIRLDLLYYTKANSIKDHLMFEAMKDMFK